jgi:hypothetical protein
VDQLQLSINELEFLRQVSLLVNLVWVMKHESLETSQEEAETVDYLLHSLTDLVQVGERDVIKHCVVAEHS